MGRVLDIAQEQNKKVDLLHLIQTINKSEISSIKSFIIELFKVINDPASSANDLVNIIEKDPPLTARILRMVNSAYYGIGKRINAIKQAVVRLGFNTVKELALTQKVCQLYEEGDEVGTFSRKGLWKHSMAVALIGKLIYRREYRDRGDSIYTAGVLHDLGIILIDQFLHEKFKIIITERNKKYSNLLEAERHVLGFDHPTLGRELGKDWGFPPELVEGIGSHHNFIMTPNKYARFCKTLFIADYVAQKDMIGFSDTPTMGEKLFQSSLEDLELDIDAIHLIREDVKKEIAQMEKEGWL